MSARPPRRKPQRRRPKKRPSGRHSPWAYLAPTALLAAVTVIVLILSNAGVIGHPADGALPVTSGVSGPVQTLPVPDTPPPPEPAPPEPPPLPPPAPPAPPKTTTTSTTAATTTVTTSTTPVDTTPAETTTGGDGQRVKWTVKPGDTLFSIATQFGTSVKELQRLNPDIDPSALQVGQTLVVK